MSPGPRLLMVSCLCATVTGCAQSGSLLPQRGSVGTLKTGLSHLEYENQQLRHEVADLKAENRQLEDRFVQEEAANGELTARLNDARSLLRDRGLVNNDDPIQEAPRQTLPAGRSNKKRRKPPFAQIPGRVDTLPPADDEEEPGGRPRSPRSRAPVDPGFQSRTESFRPWLPVAHGATDPTSPRR